MPHRPQPPRPRLPTAALSCRSMPPTSERVPGPRCSCSRPRRSGPIPSGSRSASVTRICREPGWPEDRPVPRPGDGPCTRCAATSADVKALGSLSRHAYGAQFAQAWVHTDTGEVRVRRMVGVFAAGRIVNPRTARSQLIGGMTMGLSMALHEEGVMDGEFGDYANHDLAGYHVASCADVVDIEADWLDERDSRINPLGTKGIGEIGIVGTAAAVANAVYNATGVRVRELPITIEDL